MNKPNLDKLYEIASNQQGFFTAHQATKCGYSRQLQVYYVKKGEWIRHARSIFKLLCFSETSPFPDDYYITLLWSENQQGNFEGVMGYTTALYIHGLTDTPPEDIHFIVPKRFRRNSPPPGRIRFHRRDLLPELIASVEGLKVMTVFGAVRDLLMRNSLTEPSLLAILNTSLEKGTITVEEIEHLASQLHQKPQIVQTLAEIVDTRKGA
jgi:predicted transcriptional regulator of viral defense system